MQSLTRNPPRLSVGGKGLPTSDVVDFLLVSIFYIGISFGVAICLKRQGSHTNIQK